MFMTDWVVKNEKKYSLDQWVNELIGPKPLKVYICVIYLLRFLH